MYFVSPSPRNALLSRIVFLFAGAAATACLGAVDATVNGTSGPWAWQNGGLNSGFIYNSGFNDQGAPTTVTSSSSVPISPGVVVTISYVSGSVSIGSGYSFTDAGGNTAIPENNKNLGGTGGLTVWPSYYIPSSSYPVYSSELVGTFANSSGAIVGTPFAVGDLASETVPAGASQLQLGGQ
jgi:hypothetical protein